MKRSFEDELFYVFKTGKLTVIGFTARDVVRPEHVDACRNRLLQLVNEHACQELVVDLYELPIVSSWILGILASIQVRGVRVELYHPSREIRDMLKVTHLDSLLGIRGQLDAGA
jgi:anti-anti-sigma factor